MNCGLHGSILVEYNLTWVECKRDICRHRSMMHWCKRRKWEARVFHCARRLERRNRRLHGSTSRTNSFRRGRNKLSFTLSSPVALLKRNVWNRWPQERVLAVSLMLMFSIFSIFILLEVRMVWTGKRTADAQPVRTIRCRQVTGTFRTR